jgi:hypothetical protein
MGTHGSTQEYHRDCAADQSDQSSSVDLLGEELEAPLISIAPLWCLATSRIRGHLKGYISSGAKGMSHTHPKVAKRETTIGSLQEQ